MGTYQDFFMNKDAISIIDFGETITFCHISQGLIQGSIQ